NERFVRAVPEQRRGFDQASPDTPDDVLPRFGGCAARVHGCNRRDIGVAAMGIATRVGELQVGEAIATALGACEGVVEAGLTPRPFRERLATKPAEVAVTGKEGSERLLSRAHVAGSIGWTWYLARISFAQARARSKSAWPPRWRYPSRCG